MAVEGEARLAAQLAADNGLRQVVVISSSGNFALRMQLAFEEAWTALGGTIRREIEFSGDPAQVSDIATEPDTFVFLAGNAQQARVMRPYLPKKLPVYTTSQLFMSNAPTNFEFNGIHFVDMPWLVQPDSPLVLGYPRAVPPLPIDMERLYALGIDAYRLIQLLLQPSSDGSMTLDGVTGAIQLNRHQFQRTAIPALFVQGRAQAQNASPAEPVPESQATRP
jgi:outer membrane PBP1 activator LpoA protein